MPMSASPVLMPPLRHYEILMKYSGKNPPKIDIIQENAQLVSNLTALAHDLHGHNRQPLQNL